MFSTPAAEQIGLALVGRLSSHVGMMPWRAREQVSAHRLSNAQTVLRALHDHQTQVDSGTRTLAGTCM